MYFVHQVIDSFMRHYGSKLNTFSWGIRVERNVHTKRSVLVYSRSAILATVLGGLAVSCQESKVAQCNRLTTVANQTASEVQTIVQANLVPNENALSQVAMQYDRGIALMKEINLSDSQLQTYQQRFVALYTNVAKSARGVAQGIGEQNREATEQTYGTFQSAVSLEAPLVQEMNTYCTSASAPQ